LQRKKCCKNVGNEEQKGKGEVGSDSRKQDTNGRKEITRRWWTVDGCGSTAGDGAEDDERLFAVGNLVGEGSVGLCERVVLFASKVAEVGAALERHVVANRPAKHGVASFEGVEDGLRCYGTVDFKLNLGSYACQCSKVIRKNDSYHSPDLTDVI
jgi:hypothetical protein